MTLQEEVLALFVVAIVGGVEVCREGVAVEERSVRSMTVLLGRIGLFATTAVLSATMVTEGDDLP